ncbi:PAS domain S-box protein [Pelagibius litoralis]|uniref:histidine kinase n=1 Tax=Pelagibius litoralis TaxID=374515 RepID=A0A967C6L7_9PROT|nr:PAS-domain containing protein [Pelagibius litoralis]NIA68486.1 PAS domain S-box protein [Pelagibius litoralis]
MPAEDSREIGLRTAQDPGLRPPSGRGHSIDWFKQVAVMSNPLRPNNRFARNLDAILEALQGAVAIATAADDTAEPTLLGANQAFVLASGWAKADVKGKRLSDCNSERIDIRPLFDRKGQQQHWLVIHQAAPQDTASEKPGKRRRKTSPGRPGTKGLGIKEPDTGEEADFRALVEGFPNGVLVHRDFKPLYANEACARRIGFDGSAGLLAEPTLLPFLPVELHNRALRRQRRILAEGAAGPARVLRCLTAKGEPFWVEAAEKRILWRGEAAVLVSLSDVTEQVQMRRSELMLREAVDNLSDSFVLYDSDLKVVLTNRRFHELFPFLPTQQAIAGKPMQELVEASVANNVVTDPRVWRDREQFIADFIADRLSNEACVSEDAWPDGRWDTVKEQHTRSGGFVSVRSDITERKRAEFALRDQESRLEQALAERSAQLKGILANIAQGVTVTAPDMRVLLVNQGFLDIFSIPGELGRPGVHVSEFVRQGLRNEHYPRAEVEAAGGEDAFVEQRLAVIARVTRSVDQRTLADGRVIEIRQQRLPDGCIVSTYNNITDRVHTERELQRQREKIYQNEKLTALGGLLAGVSHELNNPLSVVIGQAALLESMAPDSALAERAMKVRNAADRCAKIVKTFLSMARQRPAARSAIQINDLIADVLDLVTYQLNTTDVTITCDLAPDLPLVAGDSDQLSHILVNLFINAQQAMLNTPLPHRLVITTSYLAASRQIRILVRDSGPGIPEEIRSRIFDPFFTTKPVGHGTGVGLSVCHGMVTAHGGSISVENAASGGAAFTVLLPAGGMIQTEEPEVAAPRLHSQERQILVVDDEPDITSFLVEVLEAAGHSVDVASSGQGALTNLAGQDYAAIICDLRMPHLDGPGLYGAVSETKPHLLDRFVFITGDLLNERTGRFLKKTGRPCIEKPFMPDQIRSLVEEIAARGEA